MAGSRFARALAVAFVVALAFAVAPPSPAAADAPEAVPFTDLFVDVDPCTGDLQTITISGTAYIHEHENTLVIAMDRSITTSAGYEGRGTAIFVLNSELARFSLHDMLTTEPSGTRIRAGIILVVDPVTMTGRVFHGEVTCVRP